MWGEDIPDRVVQNDSDDFVTSMFHAIHMTLEEGRKIELPEEQTEEEAMRLGILMSELLNSPPPMPWYNVEHMMEGLSAEDDFNLPLHYSMPPLLPSYVWAAVALLLHH
jgi:hypothetical protein